MFHDLWQAWRRRILLPTYRLIHPEMELVVGEKRFRVDLRDRVIGRLLYVDGDYAGHVKRLVRLAVEPGSLCLDIGANIGLCSVTMSDAVGSHGQVLAFEPETRNFRLLERNLRLNGVNNVAAFSTAVGERKGTAFLQLNGQNFGDHRIRQRPSDTVATVPMVCIDDVLAQYASSSVSVVKIDVQGYELHVLRGMQRALKRHPDLILIVEIFPEALREAGSSGSELMAYLRSQSLLGYEFAEHRIQPVGEPWIYDYIFGGKDVDCVFSRNPERLREVLVNYCGCELPVSQSLTTSLCPGR